MVAGPIDVVEPGAGYVRRADEGRPNFSLLLELRVLLLTICRYEPVFKVEKYDGTQVWRRRRYRMRRAKDGPGEGWKQGGAVPALDARGAETCLPTPGYYHFSVLDNGVISQEFWRILDVGDDLSWGIFYYSGAASVVGQTYQVETERKLLPPALRLPGPAAFIFHRVLLLPPPTHARQRHFHGPQPPPGTTLPAILQPGN